MSLGHILNDRKMKETKEELFYCKYNEIGIPLHYFDFEPNTCFSLFETSFICDDTELFFERAINYARNSVIEDYPFNKKHFFELLELDSELYIYFQPKDTQDFIPARYLQNGILNEKLFKTELHFIKKLQRGGKFASEEIASQMLGNLMNAVGKETFEKLFCMLIPIHKLAFFTTIFEVLAKNETLYFSDFVTDQFFSCSIGIYELYFYKDENECFTCWLKENLRTN